MSSFDSEKCWQSILADKGFGSVFNVEHGAADYRAVVDAMPMILGDLLDQQANTETFAKTRQAWFSQPLLSQAIAYGILSAVGGDSNDWILKAVEYVNRTEWFEAGNALVQREYALTLGFVSLEILPPELVCHMAGLPLTGEGAMMALDRSLWELTVNDVPPEYADDAKAGRLTIADILNLAPGSLLAPVMRYGEALIQIAAEALLEVE